MRYLAKLQVLSTSVIPPLLDSQWYIPVPVSFSPQSLAKSNFTLGSMGIKTPWEFSMPKYLRIVAILAFWLWLIPVSSRWISMLRNLCASVLGKRLPPQQSHTFECVRDWVRVITALHHAIDKIEKPSLDGIRQTSPIT
jgi:hypothetical protein